MTLPDTAGVNAYVLSTDGSGITSWVTTEIAHPWTPAMLTTVKLWLQGDSLTGATGDPINSWTDMSGLNVVRFTAASHQGFNLPNAFTAYTEGSICFVMRLVAEPTAGNASCGPFWLGSSPDDPHYSYWGDGNIYDDFACTVRQTVGNPTTSLATYHIGGFRSKSGDWRYFLNGAQFFHSTSNVVGWKTTPKIGYSGSNYLDGYIAEAVLLDEFASTADWQKLEGYLAHKWGLLAALDPTHPYKVDPPVVFSSGVAIGDAIVGATPGRVLFVGPSSTLAQNNTFTWDNTLKDLAIGGAYYVNAARALYVVPHVTENNWFEGNAGNQTVTGYGNFGTGDLSLSSVTTGYDNAAIGTRAMRKVTTGANNFAFGSYALSETVTDVNNLAIGYGAMQILGQAGAGGGGNFNNIAVGYGALGGLMEGYNNVVMGWEGVGSITGSTVGIANTIVGAFAGRHLGSGGGATVRENVLIGANSALNLTGGDRNTWIGGYAGPSAVVNSSIVLADGNGSAMLDYGLTMPYAIWSIGCVAGAYQMGLHIYNMQSPAYSTTNFERAVLDWTITGNILTIGTQAGGTGVKRLIAIDGFAKAGAPASGDLSAGSFSVIDDTSGGATWLVFNKAGTIRKVQLV